MHIYHHTGSGAEQSLERYQVKTGIQKIIMNSSIEEVLFDFQHDSQRTFLLDERYFDLIRCPIQGMIYEPLSIEQLNNLIEQKIQETQQQLNIHNPLMMYDNENIIIDGKPSSYLLGQQGYIQWDILLIFIKTSLVLSCPTIINGQPAPMIYPSSYFTMQFMTRVMQMPSFLILSFHEHSVKLIRIHNGFYDHIETLDRGLKHLKQILISNNVISYYSATNDELATNSMATSIMTESINFYTSILYNRVKEYNNHITTCLINPPTMNNSLFLNTLIEDYQTHINGYVVPNTINTNLKQYNRNRQMNELDVLTYLNFSEYKELI